MRGGRGRVGNGVALADRPLSPKRAMERIRALWRDGNVEWWSYAERRLSERKLDMLDVEHLIRYGRVTEHSHPGRLWRYKVEGRAVDGERIACVVEINGNLIIVTVIA